VQANEQRMVVVMKRIGVSTGLGVSIRETRDMR
jgi:hypothetical protein